MRNAPSMDRSGPAQPAALHRARQPGEGVDGAEGGEVVVISWVPTARPSTTTAKTRTHQPGEVLARAPHWLVSQRRRPAGVVS